MADRPQRYYEKLNTKGRPVRVRPNDYDGKITGHIVFGVDAYFDENPEEARRLGYTKHITHTIKEVREMFPDFDPCTQAVLKSVRRVDEWTVEDVYHVIDKSEEMSLRDELARVGEVYLGTYDLDDMDEEDGLEGVIWV